MHINLVHTVEVSYNGDYVGQDDAQAYAKTLERLMSNHDGYMDKIHDLRDKYHADFVQMYVANKAYGGLAYGYRRNGSLAFSLTKNPAAGVHELGHNMGVNHQPHNGYPYTYAKGWYSISNLSHKFRTIHGRGGNSPVGDEKYLINYWSSPLVKYYGVATGTVNNDARRAILNVAPYLVNFRKEDPGNSTITSITLNNTASGTWSSNENSNHKNGSYAKYYKFTLSKSTKVTIDLKSSTDAYMFLLSGDSKTGTIITKDDDGGDGRNSKIVKTLNAGTYTIEATTYAAGQTGSFTVRVNTKSTNVAKKSEIISPSYNTNVNSGQDFTLRWQTHGADKHRLEVYVAGYRIMDEDNIYGSSKTITIPSNRSGSVGIYLHSYAKNKSLGQVRHQLRAH